jgi:predicted aspartyl protease
VPQSISLRIYRDFLIIAEGRFGCGHELENFVLDTGVAPSVINRRVSKSLGLEPRPSAMSIMGEVTPTESAILPEIDLGPIRVISLPVQIEDLSRLERDLGMRVAGILGLDVLSKANFRLDYDKKRLTFENSPFEKSDTSGIPVPFDAKAGIAVANVKLDGKASRMLVDTGSDRVVFLEGGSKATEDLAQKASWENQGMAGQTMRTQILFGREIVLGAERFTLAKTYLLPGDRDPAFDGVLGVRALGIRAIAYDRTSALMFLQK